MKLRGLRVALAAGASLAVAGGLLAQGVGAAAADDGGRGGRGAVLYVSANGSPANRGRSCQSATYPTIQGAVDAASPGATVVVCKGVYHEQVVVAKPLTLEGRGAIIDETGVKPTFTVDIPPPGPGALTIFAGVVIVSSHVSFNGFTVRDAQGEGILAAGVPPNSPLRDVSITGATVVHNDLGPADSPYFECQPQGQVPGDCGEGIHFIAVAWSTVSHNFISGNSGGILLTDETGPTHDNQIVGNVVTGNQSDCGITVPGHNPDALDAQGRRQPSVAGVYRNSIIGNTITDNGHLGEGAGVLFANASGGTASYDNLVQGNYIAGNQLAGVTMHAHLLDPTMDPNASRGEDLNGNRVVGNVIGRNNIPGQFVVGDGLDGVVTVTPTTGVLVWAGPVTVRVTIQGNTIFNNHFGIWLGLTSNVRANLAGNSFHNVDVPVQLFAGV